jgi:putative transposase
VLGLFGEDRATAQLCYREFVLEGMNEESPWGQLKGQIFLGEKAFIETAQAKKTEEGNAEIPRLQRYASRPSLPDLSGSVILIGEERNKFIRSAHRDYGYTLKEIGDYLGIHYSTVSKVVNATKVIFQDLTPQTS